MNDYLYKLEQVDGFSSALIGAIGKLKGYFARICLVLHVAARRDPLDGRRRLLEVCEFPDDFSRADGERLSKLILQHDPNALIEHQSAALNTSAVISRRTAEAAEKVLREFLLPHIFGLYDVVVNGGQDRDQLRSIGDFVLAFNGDRLRPSDITSGVRALRGLPEQKGQGMDGAFLRYGLARATATGREAGRAA